MVEPVMYFGIGFLVAALLALLFVPLVHNRAVRLTMRRLEAATPLSLAEIRADKDQLRAEFAMSTRRLEMSVERMKVSTTGQLAEIGKKTDAINRLRNELGEKTATITALEERDKNLRDQLRVTEQEFDHKSATLHEAERGLADKQDDLARLVAELGERSMMADTQRVELAALRTQIEAMKVSVADYDHAVRITEERLARQRAEADAAAAQSSEARAMVNALGARADELERQLLAQTSEAEVMGRRMQELETRLGDQGRLLGEREFEASRLRNELAAAAAVELDLREKLDNSGAAERAENALLRERVNDVAAEMARLTAVLEGPGSAIETMLAEAAILRQATGQGEAAEAPALNGAGSEAGATTIEQPQQGKGTLADRIRALQSGASRLASN
jgi:DNA repair exonuclease SbcCD ATPase subunit